MPKSAQDAPRHQLTMEVIIGDPRVVLRHYAKTMCSFTEEVTVLLSEADAQQVRGLPAEEDEDRRLVWVYDISGRRTLGVRRDGDGFLACVRPVDMPLQ